MKVIGLRRVTLLLIVLFFSPTVAWTQETAIRNVLITNSPTHLQIQIQLSNSFNPKMEEAIQTGIPVQFEFLILLYQNQAIWNDKLLTSLTITKVLKYDTLKEEYSISEVSNGNGSSSIVCSDLREAQEVMNNAKVPAFFPMWKLERNKSYYVKLKARSQGVEPPGYLQYILFFLSWMNFETDWVVEKFYY